MVEEKTINGMKRWDLLALIKKTLKDITQIESSLNTIQNIEEEISWSNDKVNSEEWFFKKIEDAYKKIEEKFNKISLYYHKLLIDEENDDDDKSIKTQIDFVVDEINTYKEEIEEFKKEIRWYKEWEKEIEWLFDSINNFHDKQQEKYNKLYAKIEEELQAGTTSIALAKVFTDKVTSYTKASKKRSNRFIWVLILIICYFGVISIIFPLTEIEDVLLSLLYRSPFLAFWIWLIIFLWNRRAESKKLEESYKHKEVMARAFIWYKKSIEELGEETNNELANKHMNNLLDTMNKDSSEFLDSKWDKHPIFDALWDFTKKKILPEWLFDFNWYSFEIKKK